MHVVRNAQATVFDRGGWPYLKLLVEIDGPADTALDGGVWSLGIEVRSLVTCAVPRSPAFWCPRLATD